MGAIFAKFYSWERRRIHKLTFILADNPSLWDFKVRGAIAFDVPSNLLFITFWYHFCNRTMGSGVDCISPGIHGDRHNQIYRSGKGSPPMINVSNAQPISSAFVSISPFYGFRLTFLVGYCLGWVIFGWEYRGSVPLSKENNMQIILFHLNYLHRDRAICKWTCSYNRFPWLMRPTVLRNENCDSIKSELREIKVSP